MSVYLLERNSRVRHMHPYILLALAIGAEVVATTSLKATDGFSRLWPSVLVVIGYAISFGLLGFALKAGIPLSMGYAIWSGVGTAVVAGAGVLLYKEELSRVGFLGIAFIVIGVILLHLGPGTGEPAADLAGRA